MAESGSWETRFDIHSLANGSFTISTALIVPSETEEADAAETDIEEQEITDPNQINQQRPININEEQVPSFLFSPNGSPKPKI